MPSTYHNHRKNYLKTNPTLINKHRASVSKIYAKRGGEDRIHPKTIKTSVVEGPAVNWAKNVGVKSIQYIMIGHEHRMNVEEPNDRDLVNAATVTATKFSTNHLLLMTETTRDPSLLKTLFCRATQQQDNKTEEYILYRKKLQTR